MKVKNKEENREEPPHSSAPLAARKAATPDHPFLGLQRSAGNQAMLRMLAKGRSSLAGPGVAGSSLAEDNDPWRFSKSNANEGVYTSVDGTEYKVTRHFKKLTHSESTEITPEAEFAKTFVTIKWCRHGLRGEAEIGVDIGDQLGQMLTTVNPQQVLQKAGFTGYVDIVKLPSKNGAIEIKIEVDVDQHGVSEARVGVEKETNTGKFGLFAGEHKLPGQSWVPLVKATYTPPGKKKPKEKPCETTIFEAVYECSAIVIPAPLRNSKPAPMECPEYVLKEAAYQFYKRDRGGK